MDIAQLGLEIRSDGVVVATDRLNKFDQQAARTNRTTGMLLKAFGALAAAFSVSALIRYTNTWTDLNSRVEIATGSIGNGAATMQRLSDMARRTYSSLELTAETFLRNATAMRDLGYNTSETLDYVEAINNALVVSGAKGERAESVMSALGKAMALGKLSGDQLETVLASGGRITEALAASLGVTTLELRKLGTEGKLTGDVIYEALTSQLQLLREEADSMAYTIGDASVLLNNSLLRAIGLFDETSAISYVVATAIIALADAIDNGTISIERILAVAVAMGAFMAGSWVASFVAAHGAVALLTGGLTLLRAALIRTGIGALIVLAGELIFQLYKVVEGAGSVGEAFERLKRSGVETWERITDAGAGMYHSMEYWALEIASMYLLTWAKIQSGFFDMIRQMSAAIGVSIPGMVAWEESIIRTMGQGLELHTAALAAQEAARAAFGAMTGDKSTMSDTGAMPGFGELAALGGEAGGGGGRSPAGAGSTKRDPYADLVRGAKEFIATQELEARALGMTEEAASRLRYEQDMLNQAANDNIKLTPTQRNELSALATEMAAVEEATRRVTEIYNFGKEVFGGFFSDMKNGLKEGKSLWESLGDAGMNALSKITDKALEMATNGIWDMLFGAVMGGFGMSSGMPGTSSITGSSGGFFPGFNANGTDNWRGGLSWVGERGPELVNLPRGAQVIPNGPSMAMAANGNGLTVVRIELSGDVEGRILEQSGQQSVQIVRAAAPSISEQGSKGAGSMLAGGDFDRSMSRFGVQPQAKRR